MCDSGSEEKESVKEVRELRTRKSKLERVSSDITKHRKTQEALRESEERYRVLVGNIPGMVYRGKPDWSVDFISNPEKICGYNIEEFTSQKVNWAEIIHPDDREMVLADASKLEKESTSTIQEYRIKAKDDTIRWVEDHKVSITADKGVFIGVDGVVFDITERKKAEEALRKSEERYRTLCESSLDGIATANLNGTITDCNRAYAQMLGYSSEELKKIRYQDITPSKWHALNEKIFLQVMKRGYSDVFEKEYIRKNGTVFPVSLHSWRIDDKDGNAVGVGSVVRDITERKKIEKSLRDSKEKMRSFLELSPDSIIIVGPDHTIQFTNRAASGKRGEKVIGKSVYEFIESQYHKEFRKALSQTFAAGQSCSLVTRGIDTNGKKGWFENRLAPIKHNGSVTAVMVVSTNITKRRKVEEKLKQSREFLNSTINALDDSFFVKDEEHRWTILNDAACKAIGRPREKLIGKSDYDLFPKEQADEFWEKDNLVLKTGQTNVNEEEVTWRGKVHTISTKKSLFKDFITGKRFIVGTARDITERKRAQEALQESEQKYRALVEQSLYGIVILQDYRIVFANAAAAKIPELTIDQVLSLSLEDMMAFIPPHNRATIRERLMNRFAGKNEPGNYELQLVRRNGEEFWLNLFFSNIEYQGKPAIQLAFTDITERKRAEEALRRSEKRFREFFENTSVGVYRTTPDGQILMANPALVHMLGYSSFEELRQHNLEEEGFEPQYSRSMFKEEIERKGRIVGWESMWITRDRKILYVIENTRAVKSEDGNVLYYEGTAENITERKKTEEALRESEQRYRAIFEQAADSIVLIDAKTGELVEFNDRAHKNLSYTREEFRNLKIPDFDVIESAEDAKRHLEYVIRTGLDSFETIHRTKEGEIRNIQISSRAISIRDKDFVQSIWYDITDRKKAEESLIESEEKFRNLAEQSPNMIFINKRGRVVYANKQCEEVMGYKREEFYHPDFDFMALIAPEYTQLIKTNFSRHMNGEEINPYEYGLITKDGERLDTIITTKLIKYDGEDSILGTITDITERKKAQEEIVKLAKFPAEDPNPVLRISRDCKILYANSASSVVLDTWGRKVGERLPKDCCERVGEVFRSGTASTFELHCHNGQIFEVKLTPIVESGYANAYGLDITERKLAEEKLLEYQKQLKSLASQLTLAEERERRQIATELHDEISQSLFISKMKLEALHKSPSDKEFNDTLDQINTSLGRIIAAMRSLTFDLSSPILYEFGFEEAVAEWLDEQVEKKHGIATDLEDDGLSKQMDNDIRVILFRNVRELLINVVKHSRAKKVKVSIQKVGKQIRISVEDDGVGFDCARAESMLTKKEAFGLFSIRERLEHLGGNLDIKSSPGRGCKITITSPLKREDIREGK